MSAKGKRNGWFVFQLFAYPIAGLVTSLAFTLSEPDLPIEVSWTYSYGPSDVTPNGVPVSGVGKVVGWTSWRQALYQRTVYYEIQPGVHTLLASLRKAELVPGIPESTFDPELGRRKVSSVESIWDVVDADLRGFPCYCVTAWRGYRVVAGARVWYENTYFDLASAAGWSRDPIWQLAVTPIGEGLYINTLFWGALWYAVLFWPLRLLPWSAASRRRRGLCVECGYDLTGSMGRCPECGTVTATEAGRVRVAEVQTIK